MVISIETDFNGTHFNGLRFNWSNLKRPVRIFNALFVCPITIPWSKRQEWSVNYRPQLSYHCPQWFKEASLQGERMMNRIWIKAERDGRIPPKKQKTTSQFLIIAILFALCMLKRNPPKASSSFFFFIHITSPGENIWKEEDTRIFFSQRQ